MLVLLNAQVVNIEDVTKAAALAQRAAPMGLAQLSNGQVMWMLRALAFQTGDFTTGDAETVMTAAALVMLKFDVNAILAITPPGAKSGAHTGIRLADVALPIISHLWYLQNKGALTNSVVNFEVWTRAA